ncbi:hypothetical protein MF672_025390 [Actinomadura sp. ATCC 31491]|uniref:DUF2637 domain-containing protein n=1 Tax=Actinomadura luzonensis TaxID=2805427 RepID=A0ABT0FXM1_9ACTN|nr:hypothetical protein [Actinomadura luzonensis]MCK2217101.1 hypothetical protein [Actinomadura luzonensis]
MPRAILLVALALGVCGMHTLGHLHGRQHGTAPHPQVVAASGTFAPGHELPDLDPANVCLAVLASFIVLLLSGVRTRVGRPAGAGGEPVTDVRPSARPPPGATSRRLAVLSILRM